MSKKFDYPKDLISLVLIKIQTTNSHKNLVFLP